MLLARLDRWLQQNPSIWVRALVFAATAWVIVMLQDASIDYVLPDSPDKGVFCLRAAGFSLQMAQFREIFPFYVGLQILIVLVAVVRKGFLLYAAAVVIPLYWNKLFLSCAV